MQRARRWLSQLTIMHYRRLLRSGYYGYQPTIQFSHRGAQHNTVRTESVVIVSVGPTHRILQSEHRTNIILPPFPPPPGLRPSPLNLPRPLDSTPLTPCPISPLPPCRSRVTSPALRLDMRSPVGPQGLPTPSRSGEHLVRALELAGRRVEEQAEGRDRDSG